MTAFLAFVIFNWQSKKTSSDIGTDEEEKHTINFWNGFVLLIAVGTLLYITMMHILPEVYSHNHDHAHAHEHEFTPINDEDDEKNHGHGVKEKDDVSRGCKLITLLCGLYTC